MFADVFCEVCCAQRQRKWEVGQLLRSQSTYDLDTAWEAVMPIRIECRVQPRDRALPTEDKGLSVSLADDPQACYTDRKPESRMLCG